MEPFKLDFSRVNTNKLREIGREKNLQKYPTKNVGLNHEEASFYYYKRYKNIKIVNFILIFFEKLKKIGFLKFLLFFNQ